MSTTQAILITRLLSVALAACLVGAALIGVFHAVASTFPV